MGLIALTTDAAAGPASVVTRGRDFQRAGTAVLIQDGDPEQLNAGATECNSGYDLRVGEAFRDHRVDYGQEIGENGTIVIRPGDGVIIQTEEWVEFPEHRFGEIFPKVGLIQKGIANITTKVDPGFRGNLLVTVFNYGKRSVSLRRRDRFCSLHVFGVEGAVRPYEKRPPAIGPRRSASWQQKFGGWADRNGARVAIIEAPALVVTAVAAVWALFLHRGP
ncbi:MAG TPA: hypothetical protein VNF04_10475 [Stellaceae bacterium]|nr:hypothetical protein [Stellaceae bacterium]